MMKTALRLMLGFLLVVVVAAPSYSESGGAWHVYQCQILDDTSEDVVVELIEKWVQAAKALKAAENVEVYVFFPVAAEMGASDFRILVKVPSFAEWGALWDLYDESPAADIEDSWSQAMDCPDSWLFEGFKVEGVETTP